MERVVLNALAMEGGPPSGRLIGGAGRACSSIVFGEADPPECLTARKRPCSRQKRIISCIRSTRRPPMNSESGISYDNAAVASCPKHLLQFAVDQRYDDYTSVDHAVWR